MIHYSRDKSWKKAYLEIKQGMLRVASSKDSNKDIDKFGIVDAQVLLYSGVCVDPKKKAPAKYVDLKLSLSLLFFFLFLPVLIFLNILFFCLFRFGFMIKVNGTISNTQPRYFHYPTFF